MAESNGANTNTNSTPPPSQTTTATSNDGAVGYGGFLETGKSDRIMWLMKCPAILSRALQNHDPQQQVAKVILSIDPLLPNDDESFPECTMELTDPESGKIPKSYTMDMSKDFVPMSVFSESSSSQGKFCVEGKIKNKFDIRPSEDNFEKYGKLCRERTNKYMTRTRQVQVIDNTRGTHMRPMPGVIVSGFVVLWLTPLSERKKPPVKSPEVKRTRRDRGEMEEIMFKLFERQPNWTLKQLIQETDQPEQFMKDLLRDLCVYNNKGANQGSYELKPEYKRSAEEPPLE